MRRTWAHFATALIAALMLAGCGGGAAPNPPAATNAVRLPSYLTGLYFLNSQDGWVASYDWSWPAGDRYQSIFRTTDGGRTWHSYLTGRWKIVRLLFRSPQVGWAIAESSCSNRDTCNRVDILVTLDGGVHWGLGWSQKVRNLGTTTVLQSLNLQFPSQSVGYASVGGRVLTTSDGGFTWRVLHLPPRESPRWISFPQKRIGWVVASQCSASTCHSQVLATRDGGKRWTIETSFEDNGASWYGGLFFLGVTHGWLYSKAEGAESGALYATVDGGRVWTLIATELASGEAAIGQPDFVTPLVGWLPVDAQTQPIPGGLLRTVNGGRAWLKYGMNGSFRVSMSAISFVSTEEGWAIERVGGNPHEALAVTHTGGRSWAPVPVATK